MFDKSSAIFALPSLEHIPPRRNAPVEASNVRARISGQMASHAIPSDRKSLWR